MSVTSQLRSVKVAEIAVFDVAATALGGYMLSRWLSMSFVVVFICLLILGVAVHWALGVPTMGNVYLGINTLDELEKSRQ
jgi:NhaP-type Na+/H+ or K+/H+ antiporter